MKRKLCLFSLLFLLALGSFAKKGSNPAKKENIEKAKPIKLKKYFLLAPKSYVTIKLSNDIYYFYVLKSDGCWHLYAAEVGYFYIAETGTYEHGTQWTCLDTCSNCYFNTVICENGYLENIC